MNKNITKYDDEIDLFAVLEILWNGKWLISSSVLIATLFAFVYSQSSQTTQPIYNATIFYDANNFICGSKQDCIKLPLNGLVGSGWTLDKENSKLSLSTTTPLDVTEYEAQFELANKTITDNIYTHAKTEVSFVDAELPEYLYDSEYYFGLTMKHKKVISFIDAGQSAITFVSASVSKIPSKSKVLRNLTISAIFGGLISSFLVLIRSAYLKRKEQLTKT